MLLMREVLTKQQRKALSHRKVPVSGRKIYYSILQGFRNQGQKCRKNRKRTDPYWDISYDAGIRTFGVVAKDSREMFKDEVSADPI